MSLQVVGIVSPWIDADSDNAALRRDSAAALRQELQWAAHLSLQARSDPDSASSTRGLVAVASLSPAGLVSYK